MSLNEQFVPSGMVNVDRTSPYQYHTQLGDHLKKSGEGIYKGKREKINIFFDQK